MKQLIQDFKNGELRIEEVPAPLLREGFILVKNAFSLISTGTEKSTIDTAKLSLLEKAKKRPDLVKQVIENLKREGLFSTLNKVNMRLELPKALGYSCCGTIIDSAAFGEKFKKGDRVACAGQGYASHAEIVSVPQNLVAKIPDNVSLEEASFSTMGAIALQGVRQADIKIGENICVIGLGLIGQLTCQILKAGGCSVCGIDISDFAIETAKNLGIDAAINRNSRSLYAYLDEFTKGNGFDKVIITASTTSNDPVILSTEILRKKGVIVIVGNVAMDIPREPYFYKKELELKISTSYGPGRYDPLYEEAGVDYPYAYVRFTENRNLKSFLELLSKGSLKVKPLISRIFCFHDVLKAYQFILDKKENFIAVLLKFDGAEKEKLARTIPLNFQQKENINIGFIGAGNFAKSYLLPNLRRKGISFDTVVTAGGINSAHVARKFGFNAASTDAKAILENNAINTVFIATQHDTHAKYVIEALKNKKNIFVEKPLALDIDELKEIVKSYQGESKLMVGYNRRFASISRLIKQKIALIRVPQVMNFRINAGYIPNDHWIQDPVKGGGRIIGEVCHFVDLMSYFANSNPRRVFASSISSDSNKWKNEDNISVSIEFADGSLGSIVYTAMGPKNIDKEYLEVFSAGNYFRINDFREAVFSVNGKIKRLKNSGKGHKEEIAEFISCLKNSQKSPIDFDSLIYTCLTTLKIQQSLKEGCPQSVDINELY